MWIKFNGTILEASQIWFLEKQCDSFSRREALHG